MLSFIFIIYHQAVMTGIMAVFMLALQSRQISVASYESHLFKKDMRRQIRCEKNDA